MQSTSSTNFHHIAIRNHYYSRMRRKSLKQVVAENVSRLKDEAGISVAELARMSGLSHNAVKNTVEAKTAPSVDTVGDLARALRVQPWELMTELNEQNLIRDGSFEELLTAYLSAPEDQRSTILQVARLSHKNEKPS